MNIADVAQKKQAKGPTNSLKFILTWIIVNEFQVEFKRHSKLE